MIAKTYALIALALALIWGGLAWAVSRQFIVGAGVFLGAALMVWFVLSLCYVAGRQ